MAGSKTILVTGANGQLGQEFQAVAHIYPQYEFLFVGKTELDIGDENAVRSFFDLNIITVCINCAAYTLVDKAETEKDLAYLINSAGAENLAKECERVGAMIVHISTDYVFAGNGTLPYTEEDSTHPINIYASSKLSGERAVILACEEAIIIRTSWVYSSYGKNFVKTMCRLMSEKSEIGVVADQLGSPTYAADLANAIMQIVKSSAAPGVYHYCNGGVISWFDFAKAIKQIIGSGCVVLPIETSAYPTPAFRPHYSALNTSKIRTTFNLNIPAWETSLQKCLALMGF